MPGKIAEVIPHCLMEVRPKASADFRARATTASLTERIIFIGAQDTRH